MKEFMDADFLLDTETAKKLYHEYAENMPIIDYHCHLSPEEIYEDHHFRNITEAWLGGDHYKWRLMRCHGIEEKYITGDASDHDKFLKFADALSYAIGNPMYHWCHLELRKYFGYEGVLNSDTAEDVWNLCNEKLKSMSARQLIRDSHVTHLCTTDDPADSLEWHEKMMQDPTMPCKVMPAWRPDKAMGIEKDDYVSYLQKLEKAAGKKITSFDELVQVLHERMDFFATRGCHVSDHGMDMIPYAPASLQEVNDIFTRKLNGETLSNEDVRKFRYAFLLAMGKEYTERGWVMQIHYGVIRDNNQKIYRKLGPDAGIDSIGNSAPIADVAAFLNVLNEADALPKTILYSLNPIDNTALNTVLGCFQDASARSKIQHGIAWWFNDHKEGILAWMKSLANEGMLADSVGMLTDSRSFLSYARHDYFRRILCMQLGQWVENGEYPADWKRLETIVKGICYNNAAEYFDFH